MKNKILELYFLPIISGLLMFFAYEPFGFSITSLLSIIMFVFFMENHEKYSRIQTILKLFLYYISYSLSVLISFNQILLSDTSDVNEWYMFLFFLMYTVMFTVFMVFFFELRNKLKISLFFLPFFWFGFEEFKSLFLGGFPFIKIGSAWTDTYITGLFPIIGESGVSVFVVFCAILVFKLLFNYKNKYAFYLLLLLLLSLITYNFEWTKTEEKKDVKIVQTSLSDAEKWNKIVVSKTLKSFQDILKKSKPGTIVLFPETAIPITEDMVLNKVYKIRKSAHEKMVLMGMPKVKINKPKLRQEYSSITAMGESNDVFLKEKLIPIAEYLPLYIWIQNLLGIQELSGYVGYYGNKQENIKWNKINIAVFICYEITYSSILRERLNENTGFLAISKNTAAFNDTRVKDIHYQLIKVRSLESQRSAIISGNTGYSGVISAFGKDIIKSNTWEESVINSNVNIKSGLTPYIKYGNSIIYILLCLFIIKGLKSRRNKPKN